MRKSGFSVSELHDPASLRQSVSQLDRQEWRDGCFFALCGVKSPTANCSRPAEADSQDFKLNHPPALEKAKPQTSRKSAIKREVDM